MSSRRSRRLPLSTIGTPASGILLRVRAGDSDQHTHCGPLLMRQDGTPSVYRARDAAPQNAPRADCAASCYPAKTPAAILGQPVNVTCRERERRNSRGSSHEHDLMRARSRTRCGVRRHPFHPYAGQAAHRHPAPCLNLGITGGSALDRAAHQRPGAHSSTA